jgi:CRISPR-associated protein Cas5h
MKLIVFDIWGPYAHFKKYYATTSALTYAIPPKTSLYGFLGAILGLPKANNTYLQYFAGKNCLIGLQLLNPVKTTRIGINLRPNRSQYKVNPKPTMTEFVKAPKYRVFCHHSDGQLYENLKSAIHNHRAEFTPSLGLANLLADFQWVGECHAELQKANEPVKIQSVIPKKQFLAFGSGNNMDEINVIEQSMFAIEMDTDRNVTERDDILLERSGLNALGAVRAIEARVSHYYKTQDYGNICLF